MTDKKTGFSLIEVLVFITILSLVFITAAAITTAAIRNMKINEHKILATHYAEELQQWVRDEKEADWKNFIKYEGKTYCMNGSTLCWYDQGCDANNKDNNCVNFNSPGLDPPIYKRELTISHQFTENAPRDVKIVVSWMEPGRSTLTPFKVELNTTLSLWE